MEITIKNGAVRGQREGRFEAFKGIPFAQPPVGPLRLRPPRPAMDWAGVRDCTRFGPRPIQNPPPWCIDRNEAVYSEDCLNLNVWTPHCDGKKRPVVFYIYGGGHMEGSNSEQGMDAQHLLKDRDIVMVAPNYRVGPLGYLYLGHLLGEDYAASGSLGLMDQVMALTWVRDNIEYFGGDPNQITLMGQSAGGKSVSCLMASSLAKGLFHRAIAMSGALQCVTSPQTDRVLTGNFLEAMGLAPGEAARLLTASTKDLLQAQEKASETYFKAEAYGPTADGIAMPADLEAYILGGNLPHVPVLMGHTLQELYISPSEEQLNITDQAMEKKLRWKFGDSAPYLMGKYLRLREEMSCAQAYGALATTYTYGQGFLRTAALYARAGLPLWLYRWDFTGATIAHHSSDNEALFGRTPPEKTLGHQEAAARIEEAASQAFLNFIEYGDPATPLLPPWPHYTKERPCRMLFDESCATQEIDLESYDKSFPFSAMTLGG